MVLDATWLVPEWDEDDEVVLIGQAIASRRGIIAKTLREAPPQDFIELNGLITSWVTCNEDKWLKPALIGILNDWRDGYWCPDHHPTPAQIKFLKLKVNRLKPISTSTPQRSTPHLLGAFVA